MKAVIFEEFSYQCIHYEGDGEYTCNHPKQNGDGCYCTCCPLGFSAEQEDLESKNIDWDGLCEDGEVKEFEYLIVETGENQTEEQKKALENYEWYQNRYNKKWLDEHGIINGLVD